jgi:hypothetical protein
MFCIPCDQAWSESTAHPELQAIPVDPSP